MTGRPDVHSLRVVETKAAVSGLLRKRRASGATVGFVPTMGALHDGHVSLIRRARQECDLVVVSIFVNPTQFGPNEDLSAYPRSLEADVAACEAEAADVVFAPGAGEIYGKGASTTIRVDALTDRMEGAFRPGHFDGVCLVVCKLLNIVGPCHAYFGAKDAQQLRVVRRMVADLDIPATIVECATVREHDGLALSSRNVYLSADERRRAVFLSKALFAIRDLHAAGQHSVPTLLERGRAVLSEGRPDAVDYLECVDPSGLQPLDEVHGEALVCGAVRIGRTRLIDNVTIGRTTQGP